MRALLLILALAACATRPPPHVEAGADLIATPPAEATARVERDAKLLRQGEMCGLLRRATTVEMTAGAIRRGIANGAAEPQALAAARRGIMTAGPASQANCPLVETLISNLAQEHRASTPPSAPTPPPRANPPRAAPPRENTPAQATGEAASAWLAGLRQRSALSFTLILCGAAERQERRDFLRRAYAEAATRNIPVSSTADALSRGADDVPPLLPTACRAIRADANRLRAQVGMPPIALPPEPETPPHPINKADALDI